MTKSIKQKSRLAQLANRSPLFAGAVAVGFGAASGEADAELVIQNFNQTLSGSSLLIDLDQDGNVDFSVTDDIVKSSIMGSGLNGSQVFLAGKSVFVETFAAGEQVDGTIGFADFNGQLFNGALGPFSTIGASGFVGLSLCDGVSSYNYGWLEITRGSTTVGRVGYQTTPDVGATIPVPEPSSLTMLAIGVSGIAALRRRRKLST